MRNALPLIVTLAPLFSVGSAVGLDPTEMIGLSVVTSDGVRIGDSISVRIDAQGRPTAIAVRVDAGGGAINVQFPIDATHPNEEAIWLIASEEQWRAFLASNAPELLRLPTPITPRPPFEQAEEQLSDPPEVESATVTGLTGGLGAEIEAAAEGLASRNSTEFERSTGSGEPATPGWDPPDGDGQIAGLGDGGMLFLTAQHEAGEPTHFTITEDGVPVAPMLTRPQAELWLDMLGIEQPGQLFDAAERDGIVQIAR